MSEQNRHIGSHASHPAEAPAAYPAGRGGTHGATASDRVAPDDRLRRRRSLAAGLLGALLVTIVSAVFVICFIGGLHDPGPRSVPVGLVGSAAQVSRLSAALGHGAPGAFTVSRYRSVAGVTSAIGRRGIDAGLVPGPASQHLLVASAVSEAETNAIIKAFQAGAARAHVSLVVSDIRPLHPADPQGLSMLFFVIALLAPSVAFGNQLLTRIGTNLNEFWHLAMITFYAVTIAAVATAIADAGIGALTGAPWGIFGIGALLAFAAAAMGAATTRWAGGIGYLVLLLLFVPVGISSSGSTLGPRMITPWYADLGRALPPGTAQPAVRNVTYFGGNAIADPLLVLSAWALAGIIALALAAALHPRTGGQPGQQAGSATGAVPAGASSSDAGVPR
jgi:hypothetical protein